MRTSSHPLPGVPRIIRAIAEKRDVDHSSLLDGAVYSSFLLGYIEYFPGFFEQQMGRLMIIDLAVPGQVELKIGFFDHF